MRGRGMISHPIELDIIDIESSVREIRNGIVSRTKNLELKPTHRKKIEKLIHNLGTILDQTSNIKKTVLPLMKKDLGYSFLNENLILTAMVQPSLKNTFSEITRHFENEPGFKTFQGKIIRLGACPDIALSLAWAGDTAIKYAILKEIWKPGVTTEALHNTRKVLETNENLSILCDRWKLFENRIHFDPPDPKQETISHTKGTLLEAIFGVILIEKEITGVQKALPLIAKK
jgi:hypothetical protein